MLNWDHRTRWVESNRFIVRSIRDHRVVWLGTEHIVDLPITEEKHHALLHDILKDKVLIIITNLDDV